MSLQSRLEELREELGFRGATAAFVLPDGSVGAAAVGHADVERQLEMTTDHRMPAGSIGKTVAAATALHMAAEGLLDLDDLAARWLGNEPWFERLPNHDTITLRHLLSHSSGLGDHVFDPGWRAEVRRYRSGPDADPDHHFSPRELVAFVLDKEPLFPAGGGYSYTDTGYIVAGLILDAASGGSYYDEAERRILAPLDLRYTEPQTGRRFDGLASGYLVRDNRFDLPEKVADQGVMAFNPLTEWTGGGYVSNPQDLVRWARTLYEGRAMHAPYLEDLLGSGYRGADAETVYGLGVYQIETDHGTALGHGGWFPGWRSSMYYLPDLHVGVAFQLNQDEPDHRPRLLGELLALVAASV